MENSEEEYEGGASGGGFRIELAKSYLQFAQRAISRRWKVVAAVGVTGLVLTGLANAYIPRTFTCSTVLMSMGNAVLETQPGSYNSSLIGASSQILSRENLEFIVRDTHLVEKAAQRRAPIMRLKDSVLGAISPSTATEKDKIAAMVLTLETKLQVSTQGNLEIDADWSDPQTAADIAESAKESFLRIRHSAEVSTFEEKVTILDGHATKLRAEIEQLAAQINTTNERSTVQAAREGAAPVAAPRPATRVIRMGSGASHAEPDAELPLLKEQLVTDKAKLASLEQEHDRQLRDEQAKLADLKLRFTPAHPQVVTQEERVTMMSAVPADIQTLRQQITDEGVKIKARESLAARLSGEPMAMGAVSASPTESLPPAVVQALQTGGDVDQALAQQLTGAVARYGMLQDEIGSGRIALDTAQAAFNHRYQVIVPVEPPRNPRKPKAVVIWGAGLAATLLFVLLLPILAELRRGILLERWQVEQLRLPILAELRLPSNEPE